jgi:hypothetical protein
MSRWTTGPGTALARRFRASVVLRVKTSTSSGRDAPAKAAMSRRAAS